jgi:glycosyltransferase involved in cell wall biosynthesis
MSARLSVIMPAFNEAAGIAESVAEAHEALVGLGYEFELIIVDDGSTDNTWARVADFSAFWPRVRLLTHSSNRGYGAALRTGFEAAEHELVAFTDADGQFFLEDLEDLVTLACECPVVVGRRLDRKDPWRRRFLSWGYNVLARVILGTGVHDCDCALKVFQRDALQYLLPESAGFFVNSEMLCRARQLGFAIAEVGVRHRPRRKGVSKVSLAEIPRTFGTLMRFWWRQVVRANPAQTPVFPMPVILPFTRSATSSERKAA